MTTRFLRPAPDRFVRDPVSGKPLDPAGEDKVMDTFWLRRLADGDVIEGPPGAPLPADAAPEADGGSPSGGDGETAVTASPDAETAAPVERPRRPRSTRRTLN